MAKIEAKAAIAVLDATWIGCMKAPVWAPWTTVPTKTITICPKPTRFDIKCVDSGNAITNALSATAEAAISLVNRAGPISHKINTDGAMTRTVAKKTCQELVRVSASVASETIKIVIT